MTQLCCSLGQRRSEDVAGGTYPWSRPLLPHQQLRWAPLTYHCGCQVDQCYSAGRALGEALQRSLCSHRHVLQLRSHNREGSNTMASAASALQLQVLELLQLQSMQLLLPLLPPWRPPLLLLLHTSCLSLVQLDRPR